ncbi:hypothetical protein ACNFIA_16690 [Pseudomonas sp. NY15437]|uniref:hypothetical protein n=1 Tax=Pseudomonas sp. NY15437 TaxID=3400360 RepID=UPI003A8A6C07|nr:hypothetical protein [Pseudomonas aeruginosa]
MHLTVLFIAVLGSAALAATWLANALPVAFASNFHAVAATFALLTGVSAVILPTNRSAPL